jgi:hypothetical protein
MRLCRKLLPTGPRGLSMAATVSAGQQAMIEFNGSHFERDVILRAIRWYVAYPISYRQLGWTSTVSRLTTPRSIAGCPSMFRC